MTAWSASVYKFFLKNFYNLENQLGVRSWPLELVSERDFETSWSFLIAPSLNDNNKNPSTVSNELCFEVLIRSKREVMEEDDVVCISILAPPRPLPSPALLPAVWPWIPECF